MLKFSLKFFVGCVICFFGISHSLTRPPTPTITSASYSDSKITIEGNLPSGAEQCHAILLTDLSASLINAYESGSSLEGAAVSYSSTAFPIVVPLGSQTVERYFIAVAASKKDSTGVRIFSGWRVYTGANGLPISISTSQGDKKETVFYRARKISEHNDSLVVIDFKFSLPKATASNYSFTLKRDATPIVSFSNLTTIPDTFSNIASAITNSASVNNSLVIMREENNFYLYNIYTILSDYGKNPNDRLSGTLVKNTGEVDTAIAHIGIYGDSSYQNMISTMYDLLRVEGTVPNPIYPGTLQTIASADTLKAKLLITAMLDLSLPHNSPAPNSNEAASGIFTNYIQCMDNIVRNWATIRSGGIGLPRLRNIHANILATNKDSVIIDPIYVKNHGTLAEYGQQKEAQKRKNYAFYEGYSRLNVDLEVRPILSNTAAGLMFRISSNIQLYEANLADTFNMFDTAFISGGPSSRRIIIPSNDSLLLKFQTDGIWLKGDSTNSSEKNYYCGMESVRLKMQSGVDSIGVPFAVGSEGEVQGDVVGAIVGDAENCLFKIYEIVKKNDKDDTLYGTLYPEVLLHGQWRLAEIDSSYAVNSKGILFKMQGEENEASKILVTQKNKYRAVLQDTSTSSGVNVLVLGTIQKTGNMVINWVFNKILKMGKICFKNANNGELWVSQNGLDGVSTPTVSNIELIDAVDNDIVEISRTEKIKVFRGDPKMGGSPWFPRSLNSDEKNYRTTWSKFKSEFLNGPSLFLVSDKSAFEYVTIELYKNGASTPKTETIYLTSVFINEVVYCKQPVGTDDIPSEKWPGYEKIVNPNLDLYVKFIYKTAMYMNGNVEVQVPSDAQIRDSYSLLNLNFEGGIGSSYPLQICAPLSLYSAGYTPVVNNGVLSVRFQPTSYIEANITDNSELKMSSKFSMDVYPTSNSQYSLDADEFDLKNGYQFGKSRQGRQLVNEFDVFKIGAFEGPSIDAAISPNTYMGEGDNISYDYIYNAGLVNLTFGNDKLFPVEDVYRICYPKTAQWFMFSGHGISERQASLAFMQIGVGVALTEPFSLLKVDGSFNLDPQYGNNPVIQILNSKWEDKVKVLILNSCYNANLMLETGIYPNQDKIWQDITDIGKSNNGLKWMEILGNGAGSLKNNTALLGWGQCTVDGVKYGRGEKGQSPSDIVSNGSFTGPLLRSFIESVNIMSTNSAIEIASLWIDAAIDANNKINFKSLPARNRNCYNAVSIASYGGTIKAFAIVVTNDGKPNEKPLLTKREVWSLTP